MEKRAQRFEALQQPKQQKMPITKPPVSEELDFEHMCQKWKIVGTSQRLEK